MANTIDQAFVEQFEREVKLAYQRKGSLLRNTVRTKKNIVGDGTTFQKLGAGKATNKARNGNVVPMNPVHSNVKCTLADKYAPEYIDKLDEYKTNIDERSALVNTSAYALGRETDDQIITALAGATTTIVHGSAGMTKAKFQEALFENLLTNDVPDDGDIVMVIGPQQWGDLMDISEFASADYVNAENVAWIGKHQAKIWSNVLILMHSGLTLSSTTRYCYMYHKTAVGQGSGKEVETMIDWIPEKVAHLVNSCMSMGACLIDQNGIVEIECTE